MDPITGHNILVAILAMLYTEAIAIYPVLLDTTFFHKVRDHIDPFCYSTALGKHDEKFIPDDTYDLFCVTAFQDEVSNSASITYICGFQIYFLAFSCIKTYPVGL